MLIEYHSGSNVNMIVNKSFKVYFKQLASGWCYYIQGQII